MGYFIGADGAYHEGDQMPGDTAVPQRPSPNHDLVNGAWLLDLPRCQAAVIGMIGAKLASLEAAGMTFQGKTIALDKDAQAHIGQEATRARAAIDGKAAWPADFVWTAADGSAISLDAAAMWDMAIAADDQVRAWILNAGRHEVAVKGMTDAAAVLAYDFSGGW